MIQYKLYNKKAKFEYILMDEFEAGLVLTPERITRFKRDKSCIKIEGSFCTIVNDELWVNGLSFGTLIDPIKLLLHKKEISKIKKQLIIKGNTFIPTSIYLVKGRLKMTACVAKGKNVRDKRETIKQRDLERETKTIKA